MGEVILAILKDLGVVCSSAVKSLVQEVMVMVSNSAILITYGLLFTVSQALAAAF